MLDYHESRASNPIIENVRKSKGMCAKQTCNTVLYQHVILYQHVPAKLKCFSSTRQNPIFPLYSPKMSGGMKILYIIYTFRTNKMFPVSFEQFFSLFTLPAETNTSAKWPSFSILHMSCHDQIWSFLCWTTPILIPLVIKHGWMENPLSMEILMGKSQISMVHIPMFDLGPHGWGHTGPLGLGLWPRQWIHCDLRSFPLSIFKGWISKQTWDSQWYPPEVKHSNGRYTIYKWFT